MCFCFNQFQTETFTFTWANLINLIKTTDDFHQLNYKQQTLLSPKVNPP